jgi:4-amino-4-deoxy-L-arabinose transferase-like glycosyltransferase
MAAAEPAAATLPKPGRLAWNTPAGFAVLVAAYGLVHLALRLALSSTLTIDDSREAVLAQTLDWGYQPRQPPLYNWLVWVAFQVVGPGVLGLTLVKYAVLGAAYGFVYGSARRILADGRLPALAAFSLLLMVPIGWVVHESLTHSITVLAAAAATFYTLLRLETRGSHGAYVAFGLAVAAGLLSKFSYALFAGALLLAALTVPAYRARLLHPRVGLAALAAALAVLPFAVWFYDHQFSLTRIYAEEVDPGEPEPYLLGVLSAVYYLARVSAYYLTPAWLFLLALFPAAWRAAGAARPPAPAERLLARFFLAEGSLVLAGALFAGVTYLKFRWMMPAFFLFPLYLFARVDRRPLDAGRLRWYARVLVLTAAVAAAAFVVNIWRGDRLGRPSHLNAPYDALAAQVAAAGFTRGTIAGGEGSAAGNLRLSFPRARVLRIANPDYVPPDPAGGGQCLIVWEKERSETVPTEVARWLEAALGVRLPPDLPVRTVELPYHFSRDHRLRTRFVLLPQGLGRCQ